jgi:hypothetical protein
MSANIKASTDGTQASIGVGGVDQMTVSNAGVVTANSFVGQMNSSSVTATGSTTARTLATRFADVVNVKDFGAVGDGVADDTAALQAAFNNTNFVNAYIMSPAGYNYRVTNTLVLDRDRFTLDFNKCGITMDDPTGLKDTLKIGNGTTQRNSIVIKNITFGRVQAATAGYALNLDRTGVIYVQECRVFGDNKVHGGIRVFNGIMVHIENNMIDRCINYGIYLAGTDTVDRSIDIVIRENRVDYCYNGLQIWDCVEGVYFRDNIFFGNTNNAVNVDASTAARGLVSFKFQENDFDGSVQTGFYLDKVSNVQLTDNWFSSNTNTGLAANLYIGPDASGVIVDGNQFYCEPGPYISLRSDGSDVVISSNLMSGGTTGMLIMGTLYSITGNSIKYLTTGINLFSANKYTVTGNDFENVTFPMGISGGASEIVVANNGGYCVGSKTYDPPSIAPGGETTTTVTVNGANFGDIVNVSFGRHDWDIGVIIYGAVTAADTVTVRFYNTRSYNVDFPSAALNVSVTKAIQV